MLTRLGSFASRRRLRGRSEQISSEWKGLLLLFFFFLREADFQQAFLQYGSWEGQWKGEKNNKNLPQSEAGPLRSRSYSELLVFLLGCRVLPQAFSGPERRGTEQRSRASPHAPGRRKRRSSLLRSPPAPAARVLCANVIFESSSGRTQINLASRLFAVCPNAQWRLGGEGNPWS